MIEYAEVCWKKCYELGVFGSKSWFKCELTLKKQHLAKARKKFSETIVNFVPLTNHKSNAS